MTITPTSRQRRIIDLLELHGRMTIQELMAELAVSPMTIHRDLNKLAETGRVVKTHGGAALPETPETPVATAGCAICKRTIPERTAVVIQTERQGILGACCPHCAMALLDRIRTTDLVLVTDFLYGQMVNADEAAYIIGSSVTYCCRPGILAFATWEDAEHFQRGFGGEILGFVQAREAMRRKQSLQRAPQPLTWEAQAPAAITGSPRSERPR
ncbi:MAG: DeoR family transcriptional regulator [Anaerolineales bacterium]|nr:DeoR family transcriptional regulator [Anaerolineales bacterium]